MYSILGFRQRIKITPIELNTRWGLNSGMETRLLVICTRGRSGAFITGIGNVSLVSGLAGIIDLVYLAEQRTIPFCILPRPHTCYTLMPIFYYFLRSRGRGRRPALSRHTFFYTIPSISRHLPFRAARRFCRSRVRIERKHHQGNYEGCRQYRFHVSAPCSGSIHRVLTDYHESVIGKYPSN